MSTRTVSSTKIPAENGCCSTDSLVLQRNCNRNSLQPHISRRIFVTKPIRLMKRTGFIALLTAFTLTLQAQDRLTTSKHFQSEYEKAVEKKLGVAPDMRWGYMVRPQSGDEYAVGCYGTELVATCGLTVRKLKIDRTLVSSFDSLFNLIVVTSDFLPKMESDGGDTCMFYTYRYAAECMKPGVNTCADLTGLGDSIFQSVMVSDMMMLKRALQRSAGVRKRLQQLLPDWYGRIRSIIYDNSRFKLIASKYFNERYNDEVEEKLIRDTSMKWGFLEYPSLMNEFSVCCYTRKVGAELVLTYPDRIIWGSGDKVIGIRTRHMRISGSTAAILDRLLKYPVETADCQMATDNVFVEYGGLPIRCDGMTYVFYSDGRAAECWSPRNESILYDLTTIGEDLKHAVETGNRILLGKVTKRARDLSWSFYRLLPEWYQEYLSGMNADSPK